MRTFGPCFLAVLTLSLPPLALGEDLKELAVLKGPAGAVRWLSLSADGSRLATAGQGIVWDVADQRQLCTCGSPAGFGLVWLSADGQTVLTAAGHSLRVWDGKTGDERFAVPALPYGSLFTAAALSPDGAYLALASNEWSGKGRGTMRQYAGGIVTVWDLKAKKVKWKVSGVDEEIVARLGQDPYLKGHVSRLAFSPDATRLAAVGNALRIFALEPDKEVPAAVVRDVAAGSGHLQWLADGKALVLQERRDVAVLDPKTGERKDRFTLLYPRRPAPKPAGNRLPPPEPQETDAPEGWLEHQITLSADGSRLAAHILREHEKDKVRNNAVVVWDVPSRRRIGVLPLPDDTYNPKDKVLIQRFGPPLLLQTGRGSDLRIALSGDGKRLAVGDAAGVVRVYDVAQIAANTKEDGTKPAAVKPEAGDPLAVGSLWKGEKHRNETDRTVPATLKITERDGPRFKGEFTFDSTNVNAVEGTFADGKIEWSTTKALQGNANQPTAGTLKDGAIDAKFNLVVRKGDKTYTATGTVKLTKSE
jgi:WD40 repeat protein